MVALESDEKNELSGRKAGGLRRIHAAAEEAVPEREVREKAVRRHWQEGLAVLLAGLTLTACSPVAPLLIAGDDGLKIRIFLASIACALSWFGFYRVVLAGDEAGRSGLRLAVAFGAFFFSSGYCFWVLWPMLFSRPATP